MSSIERLQMPSEHLEYSQGSLVESFRKDLETPRPVEEQTQLFEMNLEHVKRAQEWLLERSGAQEQTFHLEDIILGDAPYITPYDRLKGTYELIDPETAARALTEREYLIWILNHPARTAALQKTIAEGYVPPADKDIPVLDEAQKKKIAIDFDDIGLIVTDPPSHDIIDSARTLLANGPYTWVADNLAAIPYILSSMPDVSNSFSIATHALSGGLAFVPFDSIWNDPANQLAVAQRAWETVENDAVMNNHPNHDFLLSHYRRLIGITVKASPNSIEHIKEFIRHGFTTFRIYDARSKLKLEQTLQQAVQALQDPEFDAIRSNITFLVGQISSAGQAMRIQEIMEHANGIGVGLIDGIGGGGICSTPKEASLHVANVNIGYAALKAGLKKPLLFDGGVGDRLPVLLAMGGAGAFKSQALVGGCIEQPPGMWYIRTENGELAKNFSGEAAERTKFGGGKLDFLGKPLFVEGADELVLLNPNALTMTVNTYSLLQSLVTAFIFARFQSIREFHDTPNPQIWTATENAKARSSVHHRTGRVS